MQNINAKKKTQSMNAQKARGHRSSLQSQLGIPGFMLRLARQQHVKIFAELGMPKYRHD